MSEFHEAILPQGCEKQPDGRIVDEAREVVRETTSAIVDRDYSRPAQRDLEIHQHSAAVRRLARG